MWRYIRVFLIDGLRYMYRHKKWFTCDIQDKLKPSNIGILSIIFGGYPIQNLSAINGMIFVVFFHSILIWKYMCVHLKKWTKYTDIHVVFSQPV